MHQRLFELTTLLVSRGSITATELAERFDVSTRTIYRDVDVLSSAGVPVYADRGRGGGIKLLPGYVLDKSLFSKQEQQQLLAHLQSLASIGAPDSTALLDKLGAIFGRQDNWLEVDFAPWAGGEETRVVFRLLRDAILRRVVVTFEYTGSSGETEVRQIEPVKILFRGQGWYVYAYARERQAFRYFKFLRMRHVQALEETFLPRSVPASLADVAFEGKWVQLTLQISSTSAFRVFDEFAAGQVQKTSAGDFLVTCQLPDGDWLTGYLLSFGSAAVVLEPSHLRESIAKEIEQMKRGYQAE